MKKITVFSLFFVIFCTFSTIFAEDDEKLILAVMEFDDLSGKLPKEMLSGATEYMRSAFVASNKFVVIAKERQETAMIKKMKAESYKLCNDKNCQIPLGKALSADTILRTSINFFGGTYTITSELIDLAKEATIIAAKEDYDGSDRALKIAIDKLVEKIVKIETDIAVQEKKPQKASSSKEAIACEYARSESNNFAWKTYLEKYPNGECAAEAKEELDKSACKTAEKENSAQGWKEYLKEFSNGKCKLKAQTTLQKLEIKEQKETESQEKTENEKHYFNSRADEKLNGIFSGRWNLGLGIAFNTPNKVGLSSGLDFDFKVFSKPYGRGAGNLFIGAGVDLRYWLKTSSEGYVHSEKYSEKNYTNNLINIPIQLNLGYEFKLSNPTLRYFGIWFSPGFSFDMDKLKATPVVAKANEDGTTTVGRLKYNKLFFTISFSWELNTSMIFKNGMLLNIGFGGNKSKTHPLKATKDNGFYDHWIKDTWALDHTFLMIGTGVIF